VLFHRDAGGLETERKLPGGIVTRWTHDAARRPLERETLVGGMTRARRLYRWREEEQLAALVDTERGETRFEHDVRGRLVGALLADGTRQHRAMDEVGNLYRQSDRSDRKYGRGGRLLEMEGASCKYDADGNLTERVDAEGGRWRYRWKGSGLLREVERPDGTKVGFEYDALARRTCKRVTEARSQRSQEVRFLWDGHVPLHEMRPDGELTTWLFEPESFAPLGKEDRTGRYGVVTDHLGTPTEMYDDLGKLAWRMQLDVFGVGRMDVARQDCPWRWPGQYEDVETGLYYNRYRYYDKSAGGYISNDPAGLKGGLAPFSYVADPSGACDPLGLAECGKAWRKRVRSHVELRSASVRGFRNAGEVLERLGNLKNRLVRAGYADVRVGIRGSSVTGFSSRRETPFRWGDGDGKPSDVDFFFTSHSLEKKISETMLGGVLRPRHYSALPSDVQAALDAFSLQTTIQIGRSSSVTIVSQNLVDGFERGAYLLY
jgi:RHS repeat-associated protein